MTTAPVAKLTLPIGTRLFYPGLVRVVHAVIVGYTTDGRYFLQHHGVFSEQRKLFKGTRGWHRQTRASEKTVRSGTYLIEVPHA